MDLEEVKDRFVSELSRIVHLKKDCRELTVGNIVAKVSLGRRIDLDVLARSLGDGIEFEPELFPGAIMRKGTGKSLALLFRTGSIIFTGAKSIEELEELIDISIDQLQRVDVIR